MGLARGGNTHAIDKGKAAGNVALARHARSQRFVTCGEEARRSAQAQISDMGAYAYVRMVDLLVTNRMIGIPTCVYPYPTYIHTYVCKLRVNLTL